MSPINTHTEVSLSQADHQVFRPGRIRLNLKLSPIASLWLLEDGISRAFPGAFRISCRYTTCMPKDTRARTKGYEHFSVDDERSSTLMSIGAESLFIARRQQSSITVPFGVDEQLPVSLAFCLAIPPQRPLYLMIESRVTPPLRARPQHTLFLLDRVLLGPLPAGWITRHLDYVNAVTTELLRRDIATMCHGFLETKNVTLYSLCTSA